MTKWTKYRDIKPSIKDIVKSKENSHDVIGKRKVKTHPMRLFLNIKSKEENVSSEEKLSEYRVFLKENGSVWLPVNQLKKSNFAYCKKFEELNKAIKNSQILWMYIVTFNNYLESDEIENKTKVIDLIFSEEELETPDKSLTTLNDLEEKSYLWVKIVNIKKCVGVTTKDMQVFGRELSLKDALIEKQYEFYLVERIKT